MNPGLYPDYSSNAQGRVLVQCQWTSGSTGAVPALSAFKYHQGIKSVTRNGAGDFSIVFTNPCASYIGTTVKEVIQASFSLAGAADVAIKSVTASSLSSPSVRIQVTTAPGVAVDPTSGDIVCIEFAMQWVNPR